MDFNGVYGGRSLEMVAQLLIACQEGLLVDATFREYSGLADQLQPSLQSLLMSKDVGLPHILGLLAQDGGICLEFLEGFDGLATNCC